MHEGRLSTAVIKQALHKQTEPDTCIKIGQAAEST